jgi:hypothetical protein
MNTSLWPKRLTELKKVLTGIRGIRRFCYQKNAAKAKAGEPLDFYRVGPLANERAAQSAAAGCRDGFRCAAYSDSD